MKVDNLTQAVTLVYDKSRENTKPFDNSVRNKNLKRKLELLDQVVHVSLLLNTECFTKLS
jgi:hypothetical protein